MIMSSTSVFLFHGRQSSGRKCRKEVNPFVVNWIWDSVFGSVESSLWKVLL
jgi:hypothetical protein